MKTTRFLISILLCLLTSFGLQARDFYVSPKGNDSAKGSHRRPWHSLQGAVDQALAYMKLHPGEAVRLIFLEGEYDVDHRVVLNGKGLQAPLTIMAEPGDSVTLMGGRRLGEWTRVNDPSLLAQWPESCQGRVWQTDLRKAGIQDLGQPIGTSNRADLYLNGKRQTLARWPNQGFTRVEKAVGPTRGRENGTVEGVVRYADERIDRWVREPGLCTSGYWYFDWYDDYREVVSIDPAQNRITLAEPHSPYGYKDGARYYGLNLLCELDSVGEYYIDRRSGMLYWYWPEGTDPARDEVRLSLCNGDFMLSVSDFEGFTMQGITLAYGRGGGVQIKNGRDCLLSDCTLSQLAQTGVVLSGGKDCTIDGCLLCELGHDGIRMSGGNRRTLEPAGHKVTNTVVSDFSLYRRTYQPAILAEGTGFTIAHNRFQSSSSSAMRLDAGEVLVEYNEICDVVRESDDQGGIDMFYDYSRRGVVVRYNYWHDILGGTRFGAAGVRFDDIISGEQVYGNVFENVGSREFGGVQIHGGKDNVVQNNVFYRCARAVTFSPWSADYWKARFNDDSHRKRIYEEADIRSQLYQERYPELKEPGESHLNRNFIHDNLAVGCPALFNSGEQGHNDLRNNTLLTEEPQPLSYYLQADVLAKYGLKPIPFEEIGPRKGGK